MPRPFARLRRPVRRRLPGSWFSKEPKRDLLVEIHHGGVILTEMRKGSKRKALGASWEMIANAAMATGETEGDRLEWLVT